MTDNTFQNAFENAKNRQVAAIINYRVVNKDKKTKGGLFIAKSLLDAFNQAAANSNPLVRRKVWFNYDSCAHDRELMKRIGQILKDSDEIRDLYNKLEKDNGPNGLIFDGTSQSEFDDEIQKLVNENIPPVIRLEFSDAATAKTLIDDNVPFERLNRTLHRLNDALDHSARGKIEDVTIVHTPLLSRSLSHEQMDALFKPR